MYPRYPLGAGTAFFTTEFGGMDLDVALLINEVPSSSNTLYFDLAHVKKTDTTPIAPVFLSW